MTNGNTTPLPTLDDVAKAAGVSTATVSRCLNDSGKVTDDTRKRVMKAVEALGYTPNFGARALAARRTFTIGAIIPTMENAIFARGLQAFQERLHDNGYTLLVSSTGYDPVREAEQIKALLARGADGLLLIGYDRDPQIYETLRTRGVPYMLSWAHRADADLPAIGFDNVAAMGDLAREVLALGHRRIGIISGIRAGNDRATDRVHGILAAVEAEGLDPQQVPLQEAEYDIDAGAAAFADLMNRADAPTVVMCINDVLAAGAMRQAQQMGLSVPKDVSITGFDDIELARILSPGLTTVHVPHRTMGTLAAQSLIDQITGSAPPQSTRLESTIKTRGSLAPPPAPPR